VTRWLKKGIRFGIPVVVIIFLLLFLSGVFRRGIIEVSQPKPLPRGSQTPASQLHTVVMTSVHARSEAVGTIQPEFKSVISAQIVAAILQIPVEAGQEVKAGGLLARLDDRDLAARLNQARESLHRAEAARDLAQSDYGRDLPLVEKAVIPRAEFDQTEFRLRGARADAERAKEALREAEVALGYAEIRSPYAAVIIDKLAEVGDLAAPGRPLLTLYQTGRLWVEADVREDDAGLLKLGRPYNLRVNSLGKQYQGRLQQIVPAADPSSRTVRARFALPADPSLIPGFYATAYLPRGEEAILAIPASALLRSGQLEQVIVFDEGRLERRTVVCGRRWDGQQEILSGLAPGERILLRPGEARRP